MLRYLSKYLLVLFVCVLCAGCGLMPDSSLLNTPTVTTIGSTGWTISSSDAANPGDFISYGVNIYYKIYAAGGLNDFNTQYNKDFLNTWTPNYTNPTSAANQTKYFLLFNSSTPNSSVPTWSQAINTYWSLTGDCSFISTDGSIRISNGSSNISFFRNVLEPSSIQNPHAANGIINKSFSYISEFSTGSGGDADLPTPPGPYYLGLIAIVYANPSPANSSSSGVQYSQPVQLNNNIPYTVGTQ